VARQRFAAVLLARAAPAARPGKAEAEAGEGGNDPGPVKGKLPSRRQPPRHCEVVHGRGNGGGGGRAGDDVAGGWAGLAPKPQGVGHGPEQRREHVGADPDAAV
jgi:hypothetical protein